MTKKRPVENRTLRFQLDEVRVEKPDSGQFVGQASAFNTFIPGWDEKVMPGAFARTLSEHGGRVPILFNHDSMEPIGMGLEGEETKKGLRVRGQLLVEDSDTGFYVQKAREAHALMKLAQEVDKPWGLSIGFRTMDEEHVTQKDGSKLRLLREVALHEYSPTAFPANPKALVSQVRTLAEWSWRDGSEIWYVVRDRGGFDEATFRRVPWSEDVLPSVVVGVLEKTGSPAIHALCFSAEHVHRFDIEATSGLDLPEVEDAALSLPELSLITGVAPDSVDPGIRSIGAALTETLDKLRR